jgi:hypothetical protein
MEQFATDAYKRELADNLDRARDTCRQRPGGLRPAWPCRSQPAGRTVPFKLGQALSAEGNQSRLTKPRELLETMSTALADPDNKAVYVKPPKKGRDLDHVSLDVKKAWDV